MNGKWQISRRTMLRGSGVAVSLPLLEVMDRSSAWAGGRAGVTPRMAYLYFPNGVADGAWDAEQVDSQGRLVRLNRWMSALEPYRNDLTLFRNMWTPRGNGHVAGTATWLTGGAFQEHRLDAGGVSADQLAAQHLQGETLLPSLELSSRGEGMFSGNLPRNVLSWKDRFTPLSRDDEPRSVFDRMFRVDDSGLGSKLVVDLVLEDARRRRLQVSEDDRRKLDEYLESVYAIERRIEFAQQQQQRAANQPEMRQALVRPESGVPNDHQQYLRVMMDMMVLAFWSDATRVATFMLDHGQSNRYFNFIDGVKGTWHALSHWKDISGRTEDDDGRTSWSSRQEKREMYNRVTGWHHQQFGYLLERLKQIRENGRPLLDHCMVVYGSSLADGHAHAEENLPLLLAGRGGGTIDAGKQVQFKRPTSMSDLHLAMLRRMGVPRESFADSRSPLNLERLAA